MKVVLFCGGLGMRMRDGVTNAPKPMAMIGDRPLIWHVMRYYAHYGHPDFVLCLGYGASAVKDFFLNYDETRSNDFVLDGAGQVELFKTDISDWRITFVDTGLHSEIGERLRRVRRFVEDEEMFLANYADVFTDAPLPDMISRFAASDAVVSLLAVPPQSSHHVVDVDESGLITQVTPVRELRQWENGGYFVLRPEIFDHLNEGEDLVEDAIPRLVPQRRVLAYPYKGYWSPADTVKERAQMEEMYHRGNCPWMVWDPERSGLRSQAAPAERPAQPAAVPGVIRCRWTRPGTRRCRCSRSARTRMTSRSRRAARCSAWPSATPGLRVRYVLMTGSRSASRRRGRRPAPSRRAPTSRSSCTTCPTGGCPPSGGQVKEILEAVARSFRPDVILAPSAGDAHQDHRTIGELVPDRLPGPALPGYEIPKWDGDLARPNTYFPLTDEIARRKIELLDKCYPVSARP